MYCVSRWRGEYGLSWCGVVITEVMMIRWARRWWCVLYGQAGVRERRKWWLLVVVGGGREKGEEAVYLRGRWKSRGVVR